MKKVLIALFGIIFIVMLAACSNNSTEGGSNSRNTQNEMNSSADESIENAREAEGVTEEGAGGEAADSGQYGEANAAELSDEERKIIYTANLHIEVTDFDQTIDKINEEITEFGGYLVQSNITDYDEDETRYGEITVRIPQERFREFIAIVEEDSDKVYESTISGEDVTEEYVDLESRLKSKQVVERRLLSFLEQAEKTEDLLKISEDLANVQEEIESIIGRMNYLENRSDLATVTIVIQKHNITITNLGEEDLNTWDQTIEQLKKSVNFLLNAFSFLFVFLVGNLPIFVLLGVITFAVLWIYRKRFKNRP